MCAGAALGLALGHWRRASANGIPEHAATAIPTDTGASADIENVEKAKTEKLEREIAQDQGEIAHLQAALDLRAVTSMLAPEFLTDW